MAFGSDGLLYVGTDNNYIMVIDTAQKKQVATISQGISYRTNGGMTLGPEGNLFVGTNNNKIMVIDTAQKRVLWNIYDNINFQSRGGLEFGSDGLLYVGTNNNYIMRVDLSKKSGQGQGLSVIQQGISATTEEDMAFGSDGLLYVGTNNNKIMVIDTAQKKQVATISQGISMRTNGGMAFKPKKSLEANYVVSINLTLRAKNEYGRISKDFLKKDYFSGNFNFKKNDLFKRDTFSTAVSVRNM
jgi:outer membrane protein assembly factor BamB